MRHDPDVAYARAAVNAYVIFRETVRRFFQEVDGENSLAVINLKIVESVEVWNAIRRMRSQVAASSRRISAVCGSLHGLIPGARIAPSAQSCSRV